MFFRGQEAEVTVWQRFKSDVDGYTLDKEEGHFTSRVAANAERVVDLFHSLTEHLPPVVDVSIDDHRSGKSWVGKGLPLDDVREQIARLKVLIGRFGGAEISVYTSEDQLTLTPYLDLYVYSRTDRWAYLLDGKGLRQQRALGSKSWKRERGQFPAAAELVNAIQSVVERLSLDRA